LDKDKMFEHLNSVKIDCPGCESPSGAALGILSRRAGKARHRFHAVSSIVLGVLMAFFPKCPVCWISYMSVLGIAGAESIPLQSLAARGGRGVARGQSLLPAPARRGLAIKIIASHL